MKLTLFLLIICIITIQGCNKTGHKTQEIVPPPQPPSSLVIKTIKGVIHFKLYRNDNPNTTKRIIDLIEQGFYNGKNIFKIIPNYFIQFGDPTETGFSGSGKKILNEFNSKKITTGSICLVRPNGIDSGDSQIIIAMSQMKNTQKKYLVIGHITKGLEIVKNIKMNEKIIYIK